jgi:nicotinamide riboside transporter PnuC
MSLFFLEVGARLEHAYLAVPWWSWLLQAIGLVASYTGAEMNARLRVEGFYVWLVANVALFIVHVSSGLWALALLDVLYFRINLVGVRKWKSQAGSSVESAVR